MSKILRSLFVVIAVVLVVGAQSAKANDTPVNGAFTVSAALAPTDACGTGNFGVEAHGLGQTAQGPMFLTVKKCFYVVSGRTQARLRCALRSRRAMRSRITR